MSSKYRGDSGYRSSRKAYGKSDAGKKASRRYYAKPEVKARVKEYNRVYGNWKYHNDPARKEKAKARQAVNLAVAYGLIAKPKTCQHPGKYSPKCSGKIEGHHYRGYDQENWLKVEWLCVKCHKAADKITESP